MSPYEAGFDAGERTAFADRRKGRVRCRPAATPDQRERGFWDGYEPRSEEWRLRTGLKRPAWWVEPEREEA
jgi:hypothetical protein